MRGGSVHHIPLADRFLVSMRPWQVSTLSFGVLKTLRAHAGLLSPGSAGYASMQHSLAGAVAARLGINSSHVVLRSINHASTPARRLRAVIDQVRFSCISPPLGRSLHCPCYRMYKRPLVRATGGRQCTMDNMSLLAVGHTVSLVFTRCVSQVMTLVSHVLQAHDSEEFPVKAVPFSIGTAMTLPTIVPMGRSQVAPNPPYLTFARSRNHSRAD